MSGVDAAGRYSTKKVVESVRAGMVDLVVQIFQPRACVQRASGRWRAYVNVKVVSLGAEDWYKPILGVEELSIVAQLGAAAELIVHIIRHQGMAVHDVEAKKGWYINVNDIDVGRDGFDAWRCDELQLDLVA